MTEREVVREGYLKKLNVWKGATDVIKVITGIRRCGKSTLLKQFINQLREGGVSDDKIIAINLESKEYQNVRDYRDLNSLIEKHASNGRIYVFLDEVQLVEGWERTANSLRVDYDADIYITGSNAYLLSSELATYLTGRYVEIKMLPLSFSEFLELNPATVENDVGSRFNQYLQYGSMPAVDISRDAQTNADLLLGIFQTILIKDVKRRLKVRDSNRFESIVRFMMNNIGRITSCNSISHSSKISLITVGKYLAALEEAFVFYKVYRYDIRGKRLLSTLEKYYVADTGMRNAILGNAVEDDISRQVENVVYLELLRRGYRVNVGCYRDKEVDFTAERNGLMEYYQVSLTILNDRTFDREKGSLESINDSFPKTILTLDAVRRQPGGGIMHKNVIDWLLGREDL